MLPAQQLKKKLQDAVIATGNGNIIATHGFATLAFCITGTFVGTVTFECSNDGATTWFALNAIPSNSTTAATTATTTGIYTSKVAGIEFVRARVSAYTSGSITVTATAVPLYTA